MKYVNKEACVEQRAVQNVIEEVELLREVDHPFVVSLWYTFQVELKLLFYFIHNLYYIDNGVTITIFYFYSNRTLKTSLLSSNHYLEEI